jgi:hypothetical protein
MLEYEDISRINGEVFNVGSDENNYQLQPLAEAVRDTLPIDIEIEWYGEPDHRSYRVNFDKIESLGWRAQRVCRDGCLEIYEKLESGETDKTPRTITLQWYKELAAWRDIIRRTEMYGGMLDIEGSPEPAVEPAQSGAPLAASVRGLRAGAGRAFAGYNDLNEPWISISESASRVSTSMDARCGVVHGDTAVSAQTVTAPPTRRPACPPQAHGRGACLVPRTPP